MNVPVSTEQHKPCHRKEDRDNSEEDWDNSEEESKAATEEQFVSTIFLKLLPDVPRC